MTDKTRLKLRKFFLLPTWLLMRAALPLLPVTHPFRMLPPSWRQWVARATPLCEMFGSFMWGSGSVAFVTLLLHLLGAL